MGLSNYPEGMDWAAYDDYHDPVLECGHRSMSECDCWCEGGSNDTAHQTTDCTGENCEHLQCQSCLSPTDKNYEDEVVVDNLQRKNALGDAMWVIEGVPLRWIPQNDLLKARICSQCKTEYDKELSQGDLIQ